MIRIKSHGLHKKISNIVRATSESQGQHAAVQADRGR